MAAATLQQQVSAAPTLEQSWRDLHNHHGGAGDHHHHHEHPIKVASDHTLAEEGAGRPMRLMRNNTLSIDALGE